MEYSKPFQIFDASAGSGKTYTLVKEYLKLILTAKHSGYYKHVLAITFTNKAVAEMKERIIDSLISFSEESSATSPSQMLVDIAEETGLTIEELCSKAGATLKHLMHHYALFSVETIDHFNHRLLRTFAKDLKLPAHFTVSLDTDALLQEAVDALIQRSGTDAEITQTLLEFAIQKADDDSSWDIARDIARTASLLTSENDAPYIEALSETTLSQFQTFKETIDKNRAKLGSQISETATGVLQLLIAEGLTHSDFNNGYLPKYFEKLANGDFNVSFGLKWQLALGESPSYPKRVSDITAADIDRIEPQLIEAFEQTKQGVQQLLFFDAVRKNIVPLSVIHLVKSEIETIKEEQQLLPISQFNTLIYNELKDQPAPYIYERLGERYRHFFIDEFQDTSGLQWNNLFPLIDNALSQEFDGGQVGSLLLVGDAKQAIYRWRGGDPEIFLNLGATQSEAVTRLKKNYRSGPAIVAFNNSFFSFVSGQFGDPRHAQLFLSGSSQQPALTKDGYVKMEFGSYTSKAEGDVFYAEKVLRAITEAKEDGYAEGDICILTRTRKDGTAISAFLLEEGIPVISSETLLLTQSPIVRCLVNMLTWSIYPSRKEVLVDVLSFLHTYLQSRLETHDFLTAHVTDSPNQFTRQLQTLDIDISIDRLRTMAVYESFEYLIRQFGFADQADGYVFAFMDHVHDFAQGSNAGKVQFLEHWEQAKDSASVNTSQRNAVEVMTIHKAKGLEFKVVIIPYTEISIRSERNSYLWYPLETPIAGFETALINSSSKVRDFGETAAQLYQEREHLLEMDSLNLLYVALTRASERMYLFSKSPGKVTSSQPKYYHELFVAYLESQGLWDEGNDTYEFGKKETSVSGTLEVDKEKVAGVAYISTGAPQRIVVGSEQLQREQHRHEAQELGNQLHDVMGEIGEKHDADSALDTIRNRAGLSSEKIKELENWVTIITNHKELEHLFNSPGKVYNERELIDNSGNILRPDRLNFWSDGSVTISDYKTGAPKLQDTVQINEYARALEDMGYPIKEMLLIYANHDEIIVNKA